MKKISLIAAETATQKTIRACLKKPCDFRLSQCYQTGEEALGAFPGAPPDVLLVEERLADMDGVEVVRRVKVLSPKMPVLVFSPKLELSAALPAFRAGALGFFILPVTPESLQHLLRHVLAGRTGFSDEVQTMMVKNVLEVNETLLTPGEVKIMEDLVAKKQDKDIARETDRSTGTIHCIVNRILTKFKVHRRKDAVAAYLGLGQEPLFPIAPADSRQR